MRFVALCGLLAAGLFAADQTPFAYDKRLALDVREHEVAIRNGIRVALVNFAVTGTARADGLLVTPALSTAKTRAIIWMHSRGAFEHLPDAMLLAQAGAVSLLINPIAPNWDTPAATWREPMLEAVISVRRGVDLLRSRNTRKTVRGRPAMISRVSAFLGGADTRPFALQKGRH